MDITDLRIIIPSELIAVDILAKMQGFDGKALYLHPS